jgi:hypothetical protein
MNLGPARGGALVARARGQLAAPVDQEQGNGDAGGAFAVENAAPARPPELPAAASAPVSRPANDFSPPPLPNTGGSRREGSRGWLLSTAGGLAAGLLLSAGLVGVGYYSGVLRIPDDAEPKEIAPRGQRGGVTARPPAADAEKTKADLEQLKKNLDEKERENRRLKSLWVWSARATAFLWSCSANQIGDLKEKLRKETATNPKPVSPSKEPTLAQLLQDLKAPKNLTENQLAQLDAQVYGLVAALDQARAARSPETIPYYCKLPSIIALGEYEMPLPAEFRKGGTVVEWKLHLRGPEGLTLEEAEAKLWQVKDKDKKPIAHFYREGNRLKFKWDALQDKNEESRRSLRNSVLEIKRGMVLYPFGLMRITDESLPNEERLPRVFDLSNNPANVRLERGKEQQLSHEVFLKSVQCELGNQMRVLRALSDTQTLVWKDLEKSECKDQFIISLAKKQSGGKPEEYQLSVNWVGDQAARPSRVVVHALVAYIRVEERYRVEVWHVGDTSKKK